MMNIDCKIICLTPEELDLDVDTQASHTVDCDNILLPDELEIDASNSFMSAIDNVNSNDNCVSDSGDRQSLCFCFSANRQQAMGEAHDSDCSNNLSS
jgi:hypothetical protein